MLFLALGDAKVPDARYFAFWWNIGLRMIFVKFVKFRLHFFNSDFSFRNESRENISFQYIIFKNSRLIRITLASSTSDNI